MSSSWFNSSFVMTWMSTDCSSSFSDTGSGWVFASRIPRLSCNVLFGSSSGEINKGSFQSALSTTFLWSPISDSSGLTALSWVNGTISGSCSLISTTSAFFSFRLDCPSVDVHHFRAGSNFPVFLLLLLLVLRLPTLAFFKFFMTFVLNFFTGNFDSPGVRGEGWQYLCRFFLSRSSSVFLVLLCLNTLC